MKGRLLLFFSVFIFISISFSHPHIFINNTVDFVFEEDTLKHISIKWRFDRATSYLYSEAFSSNKESGDFSEEDVLEIKRIVFDRLADFNYFVFIYKNNESIDINPYNFTTYKTDEGFVYFEFDVDLNIEMNKRHNELFFYFADTSFYSQINNSIENFNIFNRNNDLHISIGYEWDNNKVFWNTYIPVERYIFKIQNLNSNILNEYNEVYQEYDQTDKLLSENKEKFEKESIISSIFIFQNRLMDNLIDEIETLKKEKSFSRIFFILLIAFIYGGLHGLGPGHGKTLAASYFITEDNKYIKSVIYGSMFSLTQFILTSIIFITAYYGFRGVLSLVNIEENTYILQLFGNGFIVFIAIFMLYRVIKNKGNCSCGHHHSEHNHTHDNSNHKHSEKNHNHDKTCNINDRKTKKSLLAIASSSGLIPCPGIMLILLLSVSVDFLFLGFITAFFTAIGISITVILSGLLVQFAKNKVENIMNNNILEKFQKYVPIFGYSLLILFSLSYFINILNNI